MLIAAKYACLILLFLLVYIAVSHLLFGAVLGKETSGRLNAAKLRMNNRRRKFGGCIQSALVSYLSELLQSVRVKLNAGQLLMFSCVSGAAGITAGLLYFASLKGVVVLGLLLMLTPYVWLRSRLVSMQIRHRIDFLPAVEAFYQMYLLSESKNVRSVLGAALDGERMPRSVRSVFEQLYMGLMIRRNLDDCLRTFVFALGSRWADHLAAMLHLAIEDGADISIGLRELIGDMRQAIRTDHADRNRLLEIRIANFSPLLFLVVFLAVNFRIDSEQAYQYYVISETGRSMLLDALLLIGASFGMGLYLSMRKMN